MTQKPLKILPNPGPPVRSVKVGSLTMGGGAPVVVQSMCSTDTRQISETLDQIRRLTLAGCELVRVAVPDMKAAQALADLVKEAEVPIVADIHFHYQLALAAIRAGVAKVRINPGNIGSKERVQAIAEAAGQAGIAIRVGVNSGSMPEHILERDHYQVTPQGMVEAALSEVELLEQYGFRDLVVALKASDVRTMVEANRLFRTQSDIPLHLGITEAGLPGYGSVKSAIGIGTLLMEGLGETIRVSLTSEPEAEIDVCWWILEATGARRRGPELVACPTCGRLEIDLLALVKKVEVILKTVKIPIKVSVMGCVVNGPGEARDADLGLVGGKGKGLIIKHGEIIHSVPEAQLLPLFVQELATIIAEYKNREQD